MFDAGGRPMGRLFYWLLVGVAAASGFWVPAFGAGMVPQSGPPTTTVADTVYLADECMNASAWAKAAPQAAGGSPKQ